MSVLAEFTMFPTDKGESVSQYVSRIVKLIDESGLNYKLTSMGTIMEARSMEEVTEVINKAYQLLETDCNRVYATIKIDVRKGEDNRIEGKIKSVEKKIGEIKK